MPSRSKGRMTSSSMPLTLTTTTWGFGLAELWPKADAGGKSKTQDAKTKTANRCNTMEPPTSIRAGDENSRRIDGIIAHSGTLLAEAPAALARRRTWLVQIGKPRSMVPPIFFSAALAGCRVLRCCAKPGVSTSPGQTAGYADATRFQFGTQAPGQSARPWFPAVP